MLLKKTKINYNDKDERREWEKKWEIIKVLYNNLSLGIDPMFIPLDIFFVGIAKKPFDIEKNLKLFAQIKCFDVKKENDGFLFSRIDSEKIEKLRDEIKETYDRFVEVLKSNEKLKETDNKQKLIDHDESLKQSRPFCIIEKKSGYLKFGKFGKKVKIGGYKCQPFRLLRCLTEPIGVAKQVDTVFEAMREGVRNREAGIYGVSLDRNKKFQIILNSGIKELQKRNKLQGKLEFKWDELKIRIWLEPID